jgi:hypothetical protein
MVEFNHSFVGPQPEANLCPGYELTRLFQQKEQDAEWLFRETSPDTVLAQFAGAHVQLEGSEANSATALKN